MKDGQVITLSASEGISVNGQVLEGKGWKLVLSPLGTLKKFLVKNFANKKISSTFA